MFWADLFYWEGRMDELIQLGIAAYKSGKRSEARILFATFVLKNPNNEDGWRWLFIACDKDNERIDCLKQLIRINPKNEWAVQLLRIYTLPEQPVKLPEIEKILDQDFKNDRLARKVIRFLLIFQVSALIIGIIFVLFGNNKITFLITFDSFILLVGALFWLHIRFRAIPARVKQHVPFTFTSFVRRGMASNSIIAAITGAVIVLSPISLGTKALIGLAGDFLSSSDIAPYSSITPTVILTETRFPTIIEESTLTATSTIMDTPTSTPTFTYTFTPTNSATYTFTPTNSPTFTFTYTLTFTLSSTYTPTITPTETPILTLTRITTQPPMPIVLPTMENTVPSGNCNPNYVGACLLIGARDYDCYGGNGDGPYYVYNQVRVCGVDEYGLNSDPNEDNIGCESLPAPDPFPECP
jgi:hypothetical protein